VIDVMFKIINSIKSGLKDLEELWD